MPAQLGHTSSNFNQFIFRGEVHQAFHKVKPYAAHARGMQGVQFGVGHAALDGGHTTGFAARGLHGIHQCTVVGTMACGLHDHVARKAQVVAQGKQLLFGGVAGGVFALFGIRKYIGRAKHMAMRINSALGKFEFRFAGAGVPIQPAWSFCE